MAMALTSTGNSPLTPRTAKAVLRGAVRGWRIEYIILVHTACRTGAVAELSNLHYHIPRYLAALAGYLKP